MALYKIQDDDRGMFVIAGSWLHALLAWQKRVIQENPGTTEIDHQPLGIQHIADDWDCLVDTTTTEIDKLGKLIGLTYDGEVFDE